MRISFSMLSLSPSWLFPQQTHLGNWISLIYTWEIQQYDFISSVAAGGLFIMTVMRSTMKTYRPRGGMGEGFHRNNSWYIIIISCWVPNNNYFYVYWRNSDDNRISQPFYPEYHLGGCGLILIYIHATHTRKWIARHSNSSCGPYKSPFCCFKLNFSTLAEIPKNFGNATVQGMVFQRVFCAFGLAMYWCF